MGSSFSALPSMEVFPRPRVSVARVGLIAGAATAGVLIGLGLRHGTSLQPFAASGRTMLTTIAWRVPETALAFGGVVFHFAVVTLLAWLAVVVARRVEGRALVAAVIVTLVAWMLAEWVYPPTLRALTADLSRPQQLFYYGVLAVTLWGGIRFAPDVE